MKKITLLLVVFLMTALSYGQITATGAWTSIGSNDATVLYPLLRFVATDPDGTDGVTDGGMQIDIQSGTSYGEGAAYTFNGTMLSGETYAITTNVYSTSSYAPYNVYLYDLTNGTSLTPNPAIASYNINSTTATTAINLTFTATGTETGHILQLRYIRTVKTAGVTTDLSAARDLFIDNVTFNGTDILPITTWNGTTWSHSAPTVSTNAIIAANYSEAANITAKSLTTNKLGTVAPSTITIPAGYTVTLSGPLYRLSGTLSFSPTAKLIQTTDDANTGTAIIKSNSAPMVRLDYTLWSSPVAAQNLFAFSSSTVTTPIARFYSYNTATNSFDNTGISGTSTFTAGKGYAVRAPNTYTATPTVFTGSFNGVPNNGPINIALDATTPGFNLVGNPYPSPINASAFVTTNSSLIDGTLYFFSHNAKSDGTAYEASSGGTGMQYATWNSTGATVAASGISGIGQNTSVPTGIIQTGQGFIVKATTAGNLSFTNAMRVGAATNTTLDPFFKMVSTKSATATIATEKHRLWLDLTNEKGEGLSQLLVGYVDGATNEVDNLYDGEEFGAPQTSLTSQLNGKSYTIQGRAVPFTDTDRVPLAFKAATNGTYTIALSKTDGVFASNQEVFLKDNATGSVTNLKNGGYTFSASAGTAASRFELAYSKVAIEAELNTPIIAVKKQGVFQINTNGAILKEIAVFDMQGNQVLQQQDINSTSSSLTGLPAARGLLIVKVTTDNNQTQTIKIIN
jgi:hypothetical protein